MFFCVVVILCLNDVGLPGLLGVEVRLLVLRGG